MLPISVLVPTRNSMSLLPKHIEAMRAWTELVQEIVAVDSHSTDGTFEYLERELKQPNVRVLTHPPGLYQSWNFGIAQCRAKYIYISTVGETMAPSGITQLFDAAEAFGADVAISPPRMVEMSGAPKRKVWPVHALIEALKLKERVVISPEAVQLFAIANLQRGILGSSASNLYRTEILQRFPFRTDFGTAGDLAWGLEHGADIRLAVVPQSFSTFMFHPKSYAKSDYAVNDFNEKCLALARAAVQTGVQTDSAVANLVNQLLPAWETYFAVKRQVTAARLSTFWWLAPPAWRAHRQRDAAERHLDSLQRNAMLELSKRVTHDSGLR